MIQERSCVLVFWERPGVLLFGTLARSYLNKSCCKVGTGHAMTCSDEQTDAAKAIIILSWIKMQPLDWGHVTLIWPVVVVVVAVAT